MEKNFYIVHAFTGATGEYLAFIDRLALRLQLPGWRRLPHFSEDGRRYDPSVHAGVLFRVDIAEGVAKADAFIFESTYATTGGGLECGVALALKIPTLILARGSGGSSALAYDAQTGAPILFGGVTHFMNYRNEQHAIDLGQNFLLMSH